MKRLLMLLFLLSTMDCFSQINGLTIEFAPSFMERSQLLIGKENSKYTMTISNTKVNEKCLLADSIIADLHHVLVDYFKQKFTLDSIEHIKELEMSKGGGLMVSIGVDGITVKGVLVENDNERSFNFWSPDRGSNDHKLISALYKLMYKTFTKPETINYLEQLEEYFPLGLGLKKLSESPLTYKLYGRITYNEAKELSDFFGGLPTDKEIYFDMSNFNGMFPVTYESFKTLSQRNQNIFWINCSDAAKKQLTNAGIVATSIK